MRVVVRWVSLRPETHSVQSRAFAAGPNYSTGGKLHFVPSPHPPSPPSPPILLLSFFSLSLYNESGIVSPKRPRISDSPINVFIHY